MLLEGGVVGKQVARDLTLFAGRQEPSYIMRPQVLENRPQFLIGGPALHAGLVDLIAIVVIGEVPTVKQGTANPVVPKRDLFACRHGGRGGPGGVMGPFWWGEEEEEQGWLAGSSGTCVYGVCEGRRAVSEARDLCVLVPPSWGGAFKAHAASRLSLP